MHKVSCSYSFPSLLATVSKTTHLYSTPPPYQSPHLLNLLPTFLIFSLFFDFLFSAYKHTRINHLGTVRFLGFFSQFLRVNFEGFAGTTEPLFSCVVDING